MGKHNCELKRLLKKMVYSGGAIMLKWLVSLLGHAWEGSWEVDSDTRDWVDVFM